MFYLPRLFVYHVDAAPGSPQSETFKIMERRLLKIIINPAMIVVWLTGLWMAYAEWFLPGAVAARQTDAGARDVGAARLFQPAW